jgi:hypothetical protein
MLILSYSTNCHTLVLSVVFDIPLEIVQVDLFFSPLPFTLCLLVSYIKLSEYGKHISDASPTKHAQ